MAAKGGRVSAETKRKMSEAQKRRMEDPAVRKTLSESRKRLFREDPTARLRNSEGQIRRAEKLFSQRSEEPTKKRCSQCGRVKAIADFYTQKERCKSGFTAIRPVSACKECVCARVKKHREEQIARGIDVNAKKKRDRAKRRRYAQEWAAAKRRENGAKPQMRKRLSIKDGSELAVEPLAVFLEARLERESQGLIEARTGIAERRLYDILKRRHPSVTLHTVDSILVGLGCPEMLHELYPPEPDYSVGYHVLDPNGNPVNGKGPAKGA